MTTWTCVSVVNDYAETQEKTKTKKVTKKQFYIFENWVSAQSLTTLTRHQHVLVDYADTVSAQATTTRTLFENSEGFSQILKEQSGEKSYLDVFTLPIAMI